LDKGLIDSVIWYLLAVDSNKNAAISGFFEKNEKEKSRSTDCKGHEKRSITTK
jgi:hypothetical protein